jgi:IclR family acetate operon transcriptional repressor
MHARASGKALLAFLDEQRVRQIVEEKGMPALTSNTFTSVEGLLTDLATVRDRGWAVDNEEFTAGVMCVAAPFFDASAKPIGALSVSGPSFRISSRLGYVGATLSGLAEKAARHYGYSGPYPPERKGPS